MSIGWNVIFALIPPRRYCHGWPAFFIALGMIGGCTAVVGEIANLLGCVIYLKQAVTAITLVALGTSLPDTFASKIAAENGDNADAAIGNITGSNSVNVFLGLGFPWVIGALYRKNQTGEDYAVPSGTLGFSVMVFLITAIVCFIILTIRRCVSTNFFISNLYFWCRSLRANSEDLKALKLFRPSSLSAYGALTFAWLLCKPTVLLRDSERNSAKSLFYLAIQRTLHS